MPEGAPLGLIAVAPLLSIGVPREFSLSWWFSISTVSAKGPADLAFRVFRAIAEEGVAFVFIFTEVEVEVELEVDADGAEDM